MGSPCRCSTQLRQVGCRCLAKAATRPLAAWHALDSLFDPGQSCAALSPLGMHTPLHASAHNARRQGMAGCLVMEGQHAVCGYTTCLHTYLRYTEIARWCCCSDPTPLLHLLSVSLQHLLPVQRPAGREVCRQQQIAAYFSRPSHSRCILCCAKATAVVYAARPQLYSQLFTRRAAGVRYIVSIAVIAGARVAARAAAQLLGCNE